ncbi:hypothetical protein [Streptomyces sp. NPDC057496]|uniref:hypothetical protein n=1 Tax=Streptomyces sp. NPDC057496 TaxID=3346149 RepID=UPI0036CCD590
MLTAHVTRGRRPDGAGGHAAGGGAGAEPLRACGAPDLRALYEVTALLAKIQLRFSGIECPSDSDALTVLLDAIRQDTSLVPTARTDRLDAEALARLVLQAWLDTLPGETR